MFQIKEIVKPSRVGRTATWGRMRGTVTEVLENVVYVRWHRSGVEDEMSPEELVSTGRFTSSLPRNYRVIRLRQDAARAGIIIDLDRLDSE